MQALLTAVDSAYRAADEERELVERSMDIMSREMAERFAALERGQELIDRVSREKEEVQALAAALERSEQRYRRVVEMSYEGVWVLDTEAKTVYANQRLSDILGYTPDELIGQPLQDFIPLSQREPTKETIARGRDGVRELNERILIRRDGREACVLISTAPLEDDDGGYTGVLKMVTDITERKEQDKALRDSEAKLMQAQKMEAVGRFAGGIAHDFNNLLTAILGYTEFLIAEVPPDSSLRADLDEIRNASHRATALSRQILSFSRGTPVQPVVLDMNAVLGNLENVLRRLLGSATTLVVTTDPSPIFVLVDQSQLEQVILNLVLNAKDAMPSGGIVTVDTGYEVMTSPRLADSQISRPVDFARLSVTDAGPGIAAKMLDNIFEPFFTTKALGHGTGLGLSIVKGIVDDSRGHVEVESEPGKGTTFHVYLPLKDAPLRHTPVFGSAAIRGGTETILVVDDEEPIRLLAGKVLRKHGYAVLEARHGRDALLRVEAHTGPLHAVLTDVVMPEMGGPALLDELRKRRPGLGMVIMSGYAASEVGPLQVADDTRFLRKPFDAALLLRTIREAIDMRQLPVTADAAATQPGS